MTVLKRHARRAAIAVGLIVAAYAIAVAVTEHVIPAAPTQPVRLAVVGIAITLSLPIIGFVLLGAVRHRYIRASWLKADNATRITLIVVIATELAAAAAGWVAFIAVARSSM